LLLRGAGGSEVQVLTYGDGGDLPVFDVSITSCLQGGLVAGRQFPSGSTVSCDNPHDLEIFETLNPFDSQRDLPYPGRAQFAAYAGSACTLIFGSGVITGTDKSALEVAALVPSEKEFGKRADSSSSYTDRTVICLLRAANGTQLTGTRIAKSS
jgi:hypothetical protein